MSLLNRKRKRPRIDVVPLVDVLMVLIVFFLITMQFKNIGESASNEEVSEKEDEQAKEETLALNIRLPKIETAGSNLMSKEIIVSVDREGNYFLNNQPVSEDRLQAALETASVLPDKPQVLVVADEEVPLKKVTKLIDLCRQNGFDDFRLQSR